jgi:hypothetical protein
MTEVQTVRSAPSDADVRSFRERLHGPLLRPGDGGYDAARAVWNAMIDRRPALIARCANAADVIAAVEFAREHGLPLSVRGGGHGVAGKAVVDGGLMIDLSAMKGVRVDPVIRTASAEPGVLWEEFDRATQAHGLATTGGVVGSTGIAGLTLGGGQGWLAGKFGLTIDNLLAAEVVLADGRLVRASADQEPDLFWALRGAGANFGVVTSFTYRLHPLSTVLGGMVVHPLDRGRDVLRFYREFAPTQPDDLTTYAAVLTGPDGDPVVALVACHAGDSTEAEHDLAPLRGFGRPVVDTIAPIPYREMQGLIGLGFPHGRYNYWKSGLTERYGDALIDAAIEFGGRAPSSHSAIVFIDVHGAAGRVPVEATAYGNRPFPHDLAILASWIDPAESDRNVAWTRDLFAALESELSGGVYVNNLGDDDSDPIRRAYGPNYERLAVLKRRYDPTNLFRANQNIPPAE